YCTLKAGPPVVGFTGVMIGPPSRRGTTSVKAGTPAVMTPTVPPSLARKVSGMGISGSRVPRYRVERRLGEAGSGTTCLANVSVTSTRLLVVPQAIQRL